ncbi:hypothetical protein HCP91_004196 [Escherichia coli]|nr:hypothetical protein [Escherichia coli]
MDCVHHIWCPLFSQEFQDLPDGAETTLTNHQCRLMWQLLKKVRHFMDTVSPFPGGKHGLAKV